MRQKLVCAITISVALLATGTVAAQDCGEEGGTCVECITEPDIACPAGFDIQASPWNSLGLLLFDDPPASSACGPVTVTCTPPSGDSVAVGPTQVNCSVVDSSGNQNSCSFAVNVVAAPPPIPALGRMGLLTLVLLVATLGTLVLHRALR